MKSDQPGEFDKLLDEALATYSNQEPRAGLEQRVLHRIQAEGAPRRLVFWRWAAAIPVLASLLLVAVWHRHASQIVPSGVEVARSIPPPQTQVDRPAMPPRSPQSVVRRKPTSPPGPPRRDVFPTPSPLTAEEKALYELVTRFPDQAREVLKDDASSPGDPED